MTCCGFTQAFIAVTSKQIDDCTCDAAKAKCPGACATAVCAPHTDGSSGLADPSCDACIGIDAQCADDYMNKTCAADPSCAAVMQCGKDACGAH
jgi:hypothetical protein